MAESETIRIALAQVDPTVGDIDGNVALVVDSIERAQAEDAAVVVLPELVLTGYPPEDLLLKRHFVSAAARGLERVAAACEGIVALVGCPVREQALHNGLAVLAEGGIAAVYHKVELPNYGVFDERRYFEPGRHGALLEFGELRLGLTVCEDVWFPGPPSSLEALAGARLILNASASPYHRGKGADREALVARRAVENGVPMALCNAVGAQDELVFDGHSVVVDGSGRTLARAAQFEPELLVCDVPLPPAAAGAELAADAELPVIASLPAAPAAARPAPQRLATPLEGSEEVYRAIELGLADYARKNRFEHVVLGLSGGIDSALVAVLAVDALGPGCVSCVIMPSPHSSDATQADARAITDNLGCEAIEIAIEPIMQAYARALSERFAGSEPGVAEENLQARIRGNLVMALSNKFGWLALTTGNKSELSVGYATLYGDMAGGFALIKDVPKTLVYELARDRNRRAGRELIPAAVIERPPSAELKPDQLDSDSLPPYGVLDRVLEQYVERDSALDLIAEAGVDAALIERVVGMVDRSEYKRRQAPPGVKITPKAFGRDRRLPITNRYSG